MSKRLKLPAKKHDITGVRVYDLREETMPDIGLVNMADAETGETMVVNTGSKTVRLQYERHYQGKVNYFRETFSRCGLGTVTSRTDESYVTKLLGYFKARA
jgi:hypothetical protein